MQGVLWYAYNLSGMASIRALTSKPIGPSGQAMLLGRQFWVHMQGMCKPWLASERELMRSKCLKAGAFFWFAVWQRYAASNGLVEQCPTLTRAYDRFVKIAPREASQPCFWSESCFQKHKPNWVAD